MPIGLTFYRISTTLLRPVLGLVLNHRIAQGKERSASRLDRFAKGQPTPPRQRPLIWLHAASVGESRLQLAVAQGLCRQSDTPLGLLFTCQTDTAAGMIREAIATDPTLSEHWTHQSMAPFDTPGIAKRFIAHWQPDLAIFAEGEIWPNLLIALRRTPSRSALINGRMTEKSLRGWLRWPTTSKFLFSKFNVLLASDLRTATGLSALSGRTVTPIGNLKSALPPPVADPMEVEKLRAQIGHRSVLVAASTHQGEEALSVDALMLMKDRPFLIIAPRHPERGDDIAALLRCSEFNVVRRTEGTQITSQTDILLADTLGEMGLWYRLADTVYLGGGHAPGIGGHNPLEAVQLGKPVLTGPGVFNFAELTQDLIRRGGVTFVADSSDLAAQFPAQPPPASLLSFLADTAQGPMGETLSALASNLTSDGAGA